MREYRIEEDRIKLLAYIVLNLIVTVVLLVISAGLYSMGAFLFAFLTITGLWFSIKAIWKYGSKWWKHTAICEFKKDEAVLYSIPYEQQSMKYKDIKEVKFLRDGTSLKLFFFGDKVEHPSGWNYVGIVYPFQRSLLDEVEKQSIACLQCHNVIVRKVGKKR